MYTRQLSCCHHRMLSDPTTWPLVPLCPSRALHVHPPLLPTCPTLTLNIPHLSERTFIRTATACNPASCSIYLFAHDTTKQSSPLHSYLYISKLRITVKNDSSATRLQLPHPIITPHPRLFCTMLLLALFLLCASCAYHCTAAFFRDVSKRAGLKYEDGATSKYGGASVADLDGDGCPDLLLGHHLGMEVYFNQCNGRFRKAPFRKKVDVHALTPVRLTANDRRMHFLLSRGGREGASAQCPYFYSILANRTIVDVTVKYGLHKLTQRGRSALSLDMKDPKRPRRMRGNKFADLLLTSNTWANIRAPHAPYEILPTGRMTRRKLRGPIKTSPSLYVAPVDARSDRKIDVLSLRKLRIYAVVGYFRFADISSKVLPKDFETVLDGVSAIAEADFNNDGLMDIYVARCSKGDLSFRGKHANISDYLLFGSRDGRYRYAPKWTGIPRNTQTRGLTAGDFNNDGFVDISLSIWSGRDLLLMNRGDGTFAPRRAPWYKRGKANGDSATAVDYNGDGRLDIVLSEGSWSGWGGGYYRIMKNMLRLSTTFKGRKIRRNYLLVRVGSSKSRRASSMHAVVRVKAGKLKMVRRVGSPSVAVSVSYIETVHFGLAGHFRADFVQVIWTDGSHLTRWNVKVNSLLKMGSF